MDPSLQSRRKTKTSFGMTFTDVMKLAFFRLLQSCGIDPKKHVEIQDESKETKKMMSRGLTSVEGAWERFFNTIPEIDRQGTTTDSAVPETPIFAENIDEAASDTGAVGEAACYTGAVGEAESDAGANDKAESDAGACTRPYGA